MNLRNFVLIGIILLVIGVAGAGFMIGNSDRASFLSFGTVKIDKTKSIDAADMSKLKLDTGSMNVELVKLPDSETIVASLTGRASKKYSNQIDVRLSGRDGTITVEGIQQHGFTFGISIVDVKLRLALPERVYDSIELKLGSGNVDAEGIRANELLIQVGSGSIELSDMEASKTELHSGSGKVEAEDSRLGELTANLNSGDIKLENVQGSLKAETGSGSIKIELQNLASPIEARTSSGSIRIASDTLPDSASVRYSTGSGQFHNNWGGSERDGELVIGSGSVPVRLSTGSGNITLEKG
ncbi:DUF4097 domain-containing protein [Paenibacillus pasadenensis]|uniref:DUF4097 family beta strand repeat-containing protein n=1 Tax=Paenibacillus pasadenensis TaxID=217090 RepID=UPI00204027C6|nr:DUF4097 family beta strand repeat-containing protein [Paenibacillus pasadenensis]MCM3749590.1 DUF4097 domain-containing protein [Paenibacillus pasadenensis]